MKRSAHVSSPAKRRCRQGGLIVNSDLEGRLGLKKMGPPFGLTFAGNRSLCLPNKYRGAEQPKLVSASKIQIQPNSENRLVVLLPRDKKKKPHRPNF